MKFVKLSQKLKKYALNVRLVTLGYAHIKNVERFTILRVILAQGPY
jgi:hypothetical protein